MELRLKGARQETGKGQRILKGYSPHLSGKETNGERGHRVTEWQSWDLISEKMVLVIIYNRQPPIRCPKG